MTTRSHDWCLAGLMAWLGAFAGWTLVVMPLTLAAAPFSMVHLGWIGAALGALVGFRIASSTKGDDCRPLPRPPALVMPRSHADWAYLGLGTLAIAGATALFIKTSHAAPLWAVLLGLCVIGLWRPTTQTEPHVSPDPDTAPGTLPMVMLAATIVLLYLVVLRPDPDDAFYLNLPVGLKSATGGMMATDTMYGVPGWPLLGTNYRLETLSALSAAISDLSGLPVLTVSHLVLPLLWALAYAATLIVIGHTLFAGRWWVFAWLALGFGLITAGSLQSWGVHGIFRLFHGKGPLLLIVVPLIWLVVLRMERIGPGRAALLLAALELSAVGLTANAVYLAPLALGVPLLGRVLAGARPHWLLLGLAALPALAAGLWLVLFDPPVADQRDMMPGNTLGLWNMAPHSLGLLLLIGALGVAAMAARLSPRGRVATASLAAGMLILINPLIWPIYFEIVTGGLNFRLWWAVPMPMLMAVMATTILGRDHLPALVAIAGMAALVLVWPLSILNTPGTTLTFSPAKVPQDHFATARLADGLTSDGTRVLAPESVSAWLPVVEDHAAPVFVRGIYLDQSSAVADPALIAPRRKLADWINGEVSLASDALEQALDMLCVSVVVWPHERGTPPFPAEIAGTMNNHDMLRRTPNCP